MRDRQDFPCDDVVVRWPQGLCVPGGTGRTCSDTGKHKQKCVENAFIFVSLVFARWSPS